MVPAFLDLKEAFNPHIFVFGMSGSGKSYLLKSLLAKQILLYGSGLIVLDFTGEYKETCQILQIRFANPLSFDANFDSRYLDFSLLEEQKKIELATKILQVLLEKMRTRTQAEQAVSIFLDEAWKLLLKGDEIDVLIREGRKYNVGMVLASQILGDIKESFLSNVATIFCFRVQDQKSLSRLQAAYLLDNQIISSVQNLEMGSCLIIQLSKEKRMNHFFIEKISGVNLSHPFSVVVRDSMRFEIPQERFLDFLSKLGLAKIKQLEIKKLFEDGYFVELSRLVFELVELGVAKEQILLELRRIGIDDFSIAEGFAYAIAKKGGK